MATLHCASCLTFSGSSSLPFLRNIKMNPYDNTERIDRKQQNLLYYNISRSNKIKRCGRVMVMPILGLVQIVDAWAPNIDSQSIAPQLFAASLFPYLGFLYFITKSKTCPNLTLFGFYFLLAFVGATIPAGIYAKVQYGTSLANVDWLHGGAESLLTLTNLFIVIGLRQAIAKSDDDANATSSKSPTNINKKKSSV